MREKEPVQKQIILVAGIVFVGAFIVPGLDWRWGWSQAPAGLILLANGVILLSYFFLLWVFKTNSYASRIIEVEQNQPVISTGPYAIVRHPMYLAVLVLYGFSPLALGSFWAIIPTSLLIFVLVARIQNEELVLRRDLPGYIAYTEKIKYRLIPGVW
jgi:protein-S-isoprenylcysteine O-methyltransferase Ste14